MIFNIPIKQNDIDIALILGKTTAGLLGNRISVDVSNGDRGTTSFEDLGKLWGWIRGLEDQKELNLDGSIRQIQYTTTHKYVIGDFYNGGYIFYISGTNVLICTPANLTGTYTWTKLADTFPRMTVSTNTIIGSGQSNTNNILAVVDALGGSDVYAAKACDTLSLGGYTDWYLPSKDEGSALMSALDIIGGLKNFFWTSTQYPGSPPNFAYAIQGSGPGPGVANGYDKKIFSWPVRPVRSDTIPLPVTTAAVVTITDPKYKVLEYQNWYDEEMARSVIEKIRRMARKYLPKLVYEKILQTPLTLN